MGEVRIRFHRKGHILDGRLFIITQSTGNGKLVGKLIVHNEAKEGIKNMSVEISNILPTEIDPC